MTSQLLEHFITFGADLALNWLLQMTGMKAAVAAFNAAIAPLTAEGAATAAAALKPGALAAIQTDTGQAYAGFAAFLAPLLGPGAPAAAAGLAAQVDATAMGYASLDVGGYVLRDGMAMIHTGETITPASVVSPYSPSMGGGGAPSVTHQWNIQAIDARSFVQMLNDNASVLARTLARVTNSNPSLRPAY